MPLPPKVEYILRSQVPNAEAEDRAFNAAAGELLPGPLKDAFDPAEVLLHEQVIEVEKITLPPFRFRPVVMGDFALMQKLEPPTGEAADQLGTAMALIFLFTHPVKPCRDLLRQGRDVFIQHAQECLEDVPLAAMKMLTEAMQENIARSSATRVPLVVPGKENPPTPVPAAAASGAGLKSTAAC